MEEKYYKANKVWPIMHIITLQKRVLDENPWVARNLYNAFLASKNRSVERLMDPAVSRYPVAWLPTFMRKQAELFGGDTFPYGTATVSIVEMTGRRIRKARVIPEDELPFVEEAMAPLSDRDRDVFLALLDNPPPPIKPQVPPLPPLPGSSEPDVKPARKRGKK